MPKRTNLRSPCIVEVRNDTANDHWARKSRFWGRLVRAAGVLQVRVSPLQHLARPRGHSVEGSHQHLNLTHFTSYLILGLCHLWGTNWDFLTVFYDPRCRPNGTGPSFQGPQRTR